MMSRSALMALKLGDRGRALQIEVPLEVLEEGLIETLPRRAL